MIPYHWVHWIIMQQIWHQSNNWKAEVTDSSLRWKKCHITIWQFCASFPCAYRSCIILIFSQILCFIWHIKFTLGQFSQAQWHAGASQELLRQWRMSKGSLTGFPSWFSSSAVQYQFVGMVSFAIDMCQNTQAHLTLVLLFLWLPFSLVGVTLFWRFLVHFTTLIFFFCFELFSTLWSELHWSWISLWQT